MAITGEQTRIWEEIDRAESYLVCGMFDEAASLASSILKRLLANCKLSDEGCELSESFEDDRGDMLESAGMVLVQSMKHSQRTSEILKELKLLFGSLTAMPVQVFLSGVCFEMSESPSTVQGFLEEFLNSWKYVDDRYYPLSGAEAIVSDTEGSSLMCSIRVDEYLAVVELYVIALLARTVKNTKLAIKWVEKAMLPIEKRQELLRRLQSMDSTVTSSSKKSTSPELSDEFNSDYLQDQKPYKGHLRDIENNNTSKEEILKFSRQRVPFFWWFPAIKLKLGSTQLVIPTGKMLVASLLLLLYYLTRKKQALVKRFLAKKAMSMKKGMLDLWQLAFSYQVNPLAAVQTLPTTASGNR
ncbi:hypothetical protein ACP275_12G167300 [Erythranthe tilingii]